MLINIHRIQCIKNIFLFLLFVNCICFGTVTKADDLLSVYQLAEQNDDTWLAAYDTFAAAQEVIPQARAAFFPVINGLLTESSNHYGFADIGSYHSEIYSLTMTQPIFNYNNIAIWNQSLFQASQARATYAAAMQDLIVRTATQYFTVLKAKDTLYYAKEQRKALEKYVKQTTERFKVGLITITDVNFAKAQYDTNLATVIAAERDLKNQIDTLNRITCGAVGALATLRKDLVLAPPNPNCVENWVDLAVEDNFTVIAQRLLVKANCQAVHVKEAANFPNLNLVGRVDRGSLAVPAVTNRITSGSIGLELSVPIFAGGINNSKIRQSVFLLEKSKKDLDLALRTAELDARLAFRGMSALIDQEKALKVAVASSEEAVKSTDAAFLVGTRTIVDTLLAQTNLINAQLAYALARYDYVIQIFNLKRAAGTLSPCDVAWVNSWLVCEGN